jgi:Protein of unknown function (DUF3592)
MKRPFQLLGTLALGLLLAIGGYCLVHFVGSPILAHAKASLQWPSVEGIIERSEVTTSHSNVTSTSSHRKRKTTYHTYVEYAYSVNGTPHTSKVVWFGDDYSSNIRSSHTAVTERYPKGNKVKVFYDPNDPTLAVLEPGAKFSSYVIYVLGWVLASVGALLMLSGIRSLFSPL